jgi:glycerol-3-phosphate dehydrogenase
MAAMRPVDVCVIGGGATGAGCALDAQLRGLRTTLVEGGDFGSGASTASTKMAHGGVRYLQEAVNSLDIHQYRLVNHALHERIHMLRNAPHLTRPLEFLIPCWSRWQEVYYGIGVKAYDWIAGPGRLLPSRWITRGEALERLPTLNRERLAGAVSYSDGQFDDARFNLALIRSFVSEGGVALNYARVTAFDRDRAGRIAGANVEDRVSGASFRVEARVFVNATGPYSDGVRRLARPEVPDRMRPSKGVHVLFPLDGFPEDLALLAPKTEDGRMIFAIPWQGRMLVGTTDDAAPVDVSLLVTRSEVEYLLRQLNPYLAQPLKAEDAVSAFAGIRPLVSSGDAQDTKTLIRDDEVEVDSSSGLVSILGGKWTTYRLMAERTIDRVGEILNGAPGGARTRDYPLSGAQGYGAEYWRTLTPQVTDATARHLASKYGTRANEVVELIREQPDLGALLAAEAPQIRAQVVYAARNEAAETIEDVLLRRTGLQFHSWRSALEAAETAGPLLGRELGWTEDRTAGAIAEYTSGLREQMQALAR